MKYYIQTIEQIKTDDTLSEYAKVEPYADYNTVCSKFYEKLMNVSNDLGKNHTYLNIRIVSSTGVQIDSKELESYEREEEPQLVNVDGVEAFV